MSDEKFTKGEWIAFYPHELLNNGHLSVETEQGKLIYLRDVSKSTLEEHTANANLIAAAPEMYEMLNFISENPSETNVIQIRNLLAKARGEF